MLLDWVLKTIGGIGMPVRDPDGRIVAALSIAALSTRIREREGELAAALTREANLMQHVPAGLDAER